MHFSYMSLSLGGTHINYINVIILLMCQLVSSRKEPLTAYMECGFKKFVLLYSGVTLVWKVGGPSSRRPRRRWSRRQRRRRW